MRTPSLIELQVADPPDAWQAAGFSVDDGACRVGSVVIRFDGVGRGITAWRVDGIAAPVDGIDPIEGAALDSNAVPATHANGATLIDHLVMLTPDIGRTTAALARHEIEPRRTREVDPAQYGFAAQQVFFRLGEVILELIGPAEPDRARGDQPARMYGIAVNVADLDTLPRLLGDRIGRIKDAVQPGRRITTLRHQAVGMTVATAFMDDGPGAI